MKTFGSILIAGGIVLMIYSLAFMDTSVEVNYPGGNNFGMPERVNNIGLMADKQTYIIAASVLIVIGLVLCYLPKSKSETDKENKQCPQCAEQVKREAKVCRFCNYKFTEEEEVKKEFSKSDYYTNIGNEYKLKDGQTVELIEDTAENRWYFIYQNPLTDGKKKYYYDGKHNAERSLEELSKRNDYSRAGIIQVTNV